MAICEVCLDVIQRLRPHNEPSPAVGPEITATLPQWNPGTVPNCWICAKLAEWLEAVYEDVYTAWTARPLQVEYSSRGDIGFTNTREGAVFYMGICPVSLTSEDGCTICLSIIPPEGLGLIVKSSQRLSRATDDLSTAKSLFETCRDEHTGCRDERPVWYPTRLLDIGAGATSVRLIITADATPKGPYMTLSHRWSSARYTKLQSSTMAQLQRSVDVLRLPRSFQDAIRIARHLGVRYIWIDSLCIKQDKDDLSDWVMESRNMSRVYSHACLNISATRSVDGTEGLLGESRWTAAHPTRVEFGGPDGSPQSYYLIDGELWEDEVEEASLASRGWVFQERYLARKVLHFGTSQLGWECREFRALSLFPRGLPVSLGVAKGKGRDMRLGETAPPGGSQTLDTRFAESWAKLMNQYSSCEFTYAKDKLVALEGIATDTMAVRKNDTYAAGMWKSSALIDLAWWRDDEDCRRYPVAVTVGRAPSWSWASVDGEINFPIVHSEYSGLRGTYADVIDISSQTKVDQNTVKTEGSITLCCLRLPMTLDFTKDEPAGITVAGTRFSAEDEILTTSIYLDGPAGNGQQLSSVQDLAFTPLLKTKHSIFAIILKPTSKPARFQRVGAVEIPMMEQGLHGQDSEQEGLLVTREAVPDSFQGSELETLEKTWSENAVKVARSFERNKANTTLRGTLEII